jgi:hypothetical protein
MSGTVAIVFHVRPHEQRMIRDIARDLGVSEGDVIRVSLGMSPMSDAQPPPVVMRRLRLVPARDIAMLSMHTAPTVENTTGR